ncbi:MAG TPA: nucleotide exchange factor GrpE [Verrucomicrobiae bacterium]|jgi:molecular chaperone GrpE|nr:nucleotide exchange factor GrpE [Verrucomicrobiae bacterium]
MTRVDHKNPKDKTQEESQEPKDASPDSVVLSKKEYGEMTARLRELEDMKDKLLRSAADFENAKKRLAREREEFIRFSQENLLKGLLPVLDNFERAMAHVELPASGSSKELKGVISGIEMVYKQLMDVMKSQGLTKVQALGEHFDPHKHEAVAFKEEEGKDQEVLEELEPGYMLNGRLLRAAKVRIRVAPSSGAQGESE